MLCAADEPRDLELRAKVITLGSRRVIRVTKGAFLIGYFGTVPEVEAALTNQGLTMADFVEIN